MSFLTQAQRDAQRRSSAQAEMLEAEGQHAADRKAKATASYGAAGKVTNHEYVAPTKKEMKTWLAEVTALVEVFPLKEATKRRDIELLNSDRRNSLISWRRDTVTRQTQKEATRIGRGIVTHSATRRLARELIRVQSDPSWGVAAIPVDSNLFTWHCNVAAPGGLTGKGILHLELKFPPEYPAVPPALKILGADVEHPNIYGNYICVDMLEKGEFEVDNLKPYTGWSAAYGVQAMLRQLQSFFYGGADSTDGFKSGKIRIRPHTGKETWEYQMNWDEVDDWRDWEYDQHSFCHHRYATPGNCPLSYCDSTGLHGPKWIAMCRADCERLEERYQEHQKNEGSSPEVVVDDMVFARRVKRKGHKVFVTVHRAEGLTTNPGLYHESLEYSAQPYWSWKPYVKVSCKHGDEVTMPTSMNVNRKETTSWMVKEPAPTSSVWREEFSFDVDAHQGAYPIHFEVLDGGSKKSINLGKATLTLDKFQEEDTDFKLTLHPVMDKAGMKRMKQGSLGSLYVTVRCVSAKDVKGYGYDFTPRGLDKTFVQTSMFTRGIRNVRRRPGYCCPVCDHTPIKANPPLPCAIECDDAPPFALAEFHATATSAAGDNPAAQRAVQRTMDALDEEMQAQARDTTPSRVFGLPHDAVGLVMDFLPRMRERRYMANMLPSWQPVYERARYWEAQHLKCFTTAAGPEDDILGIGVTAAEAPGGRPIFSCQFDAVSHTAYKEGVRLGVWKEPFTHWIPLFIDREHAARAMPQFLPMVEQLSVGVRSTNSAWTVCGGDIDGAGKGALKKVTSGAGHVFRSTMWAGLRGGNFCASGAHYFQIKVRDYFQMGKLMVAGKTPALGAVKIGWATQNGDVNLGTDKYGFCYSTAGHKVHGADRQKYGPVISVNDIVGTLYNSKDRTISFFLNGENLGVAFTIPQSGEYAGLIPCVAMNCAVVEVDIEGGFDAPIPVDRGTLGAHERAVDKSISTTLAVMPQLMNHLVTDVMKGTLHASVKALQGYCSMHRLFLYCCDTVPGLVDNVDNSIERFIKYPDERHKVICPDLGMLLAMLTVSQRFWWSDIKDAFLTELFARHVRWSLKKSKRFQAGNMMPEKTREDHMCDEAFYANETSCKLVMFQVFFCNLVKPDREYCEALGGDAFGATKTRYDSRMGFPTRDMVDALVEEMGAVRRLPFKKWNGFFANVGAKERTTAQIAKKISDAVARSERAGYHTDVKMIDDADATKILRRTPRHPLPYTQRPAREQRFFRNEFPEDDRFMREDYY